jgi:hypothetical protein
MLSALTKALEAKNYLPYRSSSPWRESWSHALYHFRLDVSERFEGNYLLTENRLTRIEVRLELTSRGDLIWHTTPRVTTKVPLPKLTAIQARTLAASIKRAQESEQILYENARGQIDARFEIALGNIPAWPAGR